MSTRRATGFWHLKKISCWSCGLCLVLAKEIRWTGIELEMLWNLVKTEASDNLVKHHHRASLPPWLIALTTSVASAATSDLYCLLSINYHSATPRLNGWSKEGSTQTAPSSGSLYSCLLPHHQNRLWLAFHIHPIQMLEAGRQTQGSTASENVCPRTIWFCLGFFLTQMIKKRVEVFFK